MKLCQYFQIFLQIFYEFIQWWWLMIDDMTPLKFYMSSWHYAIVAYQIFVLSYSHAFWWDLNYGIFFSVNFPAYEILFKICLCFTTIQVQFSSVYYSAYISNLDKQWHKLNVCHRSQEKSKYWLKFKLDMDVAKNNLVCNSWCNHFFWTKEKKIAAALLQISLFSHFLRHFIWTFLAHFLHGTRLNKNRYIILWFNFQLTLLIKIWNKSF